ncbi:unnamed protein product [Adineta ricciae]|uniref:Ketosynthase family 3 (KS3) domain-containing protein n=1 Tax=Adineta ricciae TaxID=249248 RepID=A0A815SLW1_ADIRI|nr:unnamed protein product [Adineta ricciae]
MDLESFTKVFSNIYPNLDQYLTRRGYFLKNEILDQFDHVYFGLSEGEARTIDPAHRLLLEKFVHLLEDANYTVDEISGTKTSVFIGQLSSEHQRIMFQSPAETNSASLAQNVNKYNASARLAYHFNLRGPNFTIDTACSSSLQAVHLAVQSLRNGEAQYAVAGGTNTIYTPEGLWNNSLIQAVSPDGRSRAYCIEANGYAKGTNI